MVTGLEATCLTFIYIVLVLPTKERINPSGHAFSVSYYFQLGPYLPFLLGIRKYPLKWNQTEGQ